MFKDGKNPGEQTSDTPLTMENLKPTSIQVPKTVTKKGMMTKTETMRTNKTQKNLLNEHDK
jgi:hypothetical protein